MRDTLIIGLLLAMPVAVILASAALALLAGRLRRLRQARNDGPRPAHLPQDRLPAASASREAATLR